MDVAAVLKSLKKEPYRWSAKLPADAATFFGKRIGLEISTLHMGEQPEPPLTAHELQLIAQILDNLPKLIRKAETQWWDYSGDPDHKANLTNPHIWIDRGYQARKHAGTWALVVNLRDEETGKATDFAWHIDFNGLKFLEVWAGD